MKFTHTVPLPVPTSAVDLGEWIFGMTDVEYRACAKGHHAMGVIGGAKRLGLINVEEIAGHADRATLPYRDGAARSYPFHLRRERVFSGPPRAVHHARLVDMAVAPAADGASELHCSIGFNAPAWVTAAGGMVGNNHFVRKHLVEETGNFANDIERNIESRAEQTVVSQQLNIARLSESQPVAIFALRKADRKGSDAFCTTNRCFVGGSLRQQSTR